MPRISQVDVQTEGRAGGTFRRRLFAVLSCVMAGASPSLADVTSLDLTDTTAGATLPRASGGQSVELLSAFFGLDNALSCPARQICRGAPGKDGMPVIFSTEIDHVTLQVGNFRVTTASGASSKAHCVTLLPATDAGELRKVLLVAEFGKAETDSPASVEIVDHLHSIDSILDLHVALVDVTPLPAGPSLVMAKATVAEATLELRVGSVWAQASATASVSSFISKSGLHRGAAGAKCPAHGLRGPSNVLLAWPS